MGIALLGLLFSQASGQEVDKKQRKECYHLAHMAGKAYDKMLFDELFEYARVSYGDAGECDDYYACLKPYRDRVLYFDSVFTDEQLVTIFKTGECPVMRAYAFLALTYDRDTAEMDPVLEGLMLDLASDTTSYVTEDHGCYALPIPLFDYLLTVVVKGTSGFFIGIRTLDIEVQQKIIDARWPYFVPDRQYNFATWEEYVDHYQPIY